MYELRTVGAGEQKPTIRDPAHVRWNDRAPGWQASPAHLALETSRATEHWYVLRPYSRLGGLHDQATAEVDGVPVVTAEFRCWIPTGVWEYLNRARSGGHPYSTGTLAVLPVPPELPAIDVLPEELVWPAINLSRVPPLTKDKTIAVHRALPSGTAGFPMTGPETPDSELRLLNPIAPDPAAAAALLHPQLVRLTLDEGVAWAVEGGRLFVWTQRWLRGVYRPLLAECAAHIRRLLTDPSDAPAATPAAPHDAVPHAPSDSALDPGPAYAQPAWQPEPSTWDEPVDPSSWSVSFDEPQDAVPPRW